MLYSCTHMATVAIKELILSSLLWSLLTVEHILINCVDFYIIRQMQLLISKDLFLDIHPERIISFIRANGLTNKIISGMIYTCSFYLRA